MPIMIVIRDMLHLCDTAAEGVKLLSRPRDQGRRQRRDQPPFPGRTDGRSVHPEARTRTTACSSMRTTRCAWSRSRPGRRRGSCAASTKKTTLPGGKTQLNLHDGRNVIVAKDGWKSGDVVKLEVPSQKILETYKLGKGNMVLS